VSRSPVRPDPGTMSPAKRALLEKLRRGASLERVERDTPIARFFDGDLVPVGDQQTQLLILESLYPGNSFNGSLVLEHVGILDLTLLRRAIDATVQTHAVLRSSFEWRDGRPVARLRARAPTSIEIRDLRATSVATRLQEIVERANEFVRRPFDLTDDTPLLRVACFRAEDELSFVVVSVHMIVFDAPSGRLFARELARRYARSSAADGDVPNPPFGYYDHAAWLARRSDPTRIERALAYWTARLTPTPSPLDLPLDRPRSTSASFDAGRIPLAIDGATRLAVRATARRLRLTPFVILLAAAKILLARSSGQRDVTVGSWVALRDRESDALIGPLVNAIALRTQLREDQTVAELLADVRAAVLGGYARAFVPFAQVVSACCGARDLALNPLFQVNFVVQDVDAAETQAQFRLSELDALVGASTGYDLEFVLRDSGDGLQGYLEYARALFDDETAARLAQHFAELVRLVAQKTELGLGAAGVLRPRFESASYGCEAESSRGTTLLRTLAGSARAAPKRDALAWDGGRWSYQQLFDEGQELARFLRHAGVEPHDIVAVGLTRSHEHVASVLATLECEVVHAPVDPAWPGAKAASAWRQVSPTWLLVDEAAFRAFAGFGMEVRARRGPLLLARASSERRRRHAAAWAVYSSGTGGESRAVALPERALAQHARTMSQRFALTPDDRVLQFADPGFDVVAEEVFPTLASGATVVLRPVGPISSLADFNRFLSRHGVTVVNLPSNFWMLWAHELCDGDLSLPSGLRLVVIGSEPVQANDVAAWQVRFGERIAMIHAYGLAEAGVTTLTYDVPRDAEAVRRLQRLPIGTPLPGTWAEVRDRHAQRRPPGVTGEIWVGGASTALGYLATASSWQDRFVATARGPAVRTGDLGRELPDGTFELIGRIASDPADRLLPSAAVDRPPRPGAEARLADIWCDLLDVASVGVDDNFFELGGDSLLGLAMIARAAKAGIVLTLPDLFQRQTIAALLAAETG